MPPIVPDTPDASDPTATAASAGERFDLLVLAGAGLGHYHPIAGLLAALGPGVRVAVSAAVPADHPLVAKVHEDGHTFLSRPDHALGHRRRSAQVLVALRRLLTRRVVPALARRGDPAAPLPGLAARTAFGLATVVGPLDEADPARGAALAALVRRTRPTLVLSEGNEDWMPHVAAACGVDWAYYTTGPVMTVRPDRPVGPAGFPAERTGATRVADTVLRWAKQVRARRRARLVSDAAGPALVDPASGSASAPPAARPARWKLAFSVPELDDDERLPPHDLTYVGLVPYRPPTWWPDAGAAAHSAERDTILVSWGSGGSAADRSLLELLAPVLARRAQQDGLRVVVLTSDAAADGLAAFPELEHRPHGPTPPYEDLRRARLVIGHGGYGTIKEAVALGAPVLVTPEVVADRMETARRVLTAGVGRSVNRYAVTAAHLETVIDELLQDPGTERAVDRVGAALRDPGPGDWAVAALRAAIGPIAAPQD